jgi:putative tricarboxylic transport membrane protein
MIRTDRAARAAASVVLAAVGLVGLIGGLGYGLLTEDGRIDTGFLPAVAGGVVALLAVIDLVGGLRGRGTSSGDELAELAEGGAAGSAEHAAAPASAASTDASADSTADDIDIFGRTQRQRTRMLLTVIGLIVVALLITPLVGITIALGALLFVISAFVERRPWLSSLIVAVVVAGVFWLVFRQLLSVPLPSGLIGLV